MKTCTKCGLVSLDSSERCECGGALVAGDSPTLVEARVAGFWIRLGADLLDALVLGAIGFVIASVFRGSLLALGERAAIIGAPITLLYTGVLQSHIGGGQTLAKRLLGLRVVRLDGQYLSLDRSLVRWSIMGMMCYGSAIAFALSSVTTIFSLPMLAAALAGTQIALVLGCALLVPFHPLKRGLHDLLTGSIVLRRGELPADRIKRLHNPRRDRHIVIAAISVAVAGTVAGLFALRHPPASLQPATRVATAVNELGIQNPGVVDSYMKGPSINLHHIIATGYLPSNPDGTARVTSADDRILELIRKEMPLDGVDAIVITLRKGINLGIYSSYEATNRRIEPAIPGGTAR
jgi:uncharacterized RDD family membrane protein YckC